MVPDAIAAASSAIGTLDAAVNRPWASTVNDATALADPYEPTVTGVFASDRVPELVIGPPVNPVPVATLVTVPEDVDIARNMLVPFDTKIARVPEAMLALVTPASDEFTRHVAVMPPSVRLLFINQKPGAVP
jgi:hypothetical protein